MKFKLVSLFLMMLYVTNVSAQITGGDFFRNIGKIYVVVAIVVATFIGMVIYMVYLDRKLNKLEEEVSSHK